MSVVVPPTASCARSLNPEADTFSTYAAPVAAHDQAASDMVADDVTAALGELKLSCAVYEPSGTKKGALTTVEHGITFHAGHNMFVFTCDTKNIPTSLKSQNMLGELINIHGYPEKMQLNITTGPRLPSIIDVVQWVSCALGQFMATVKAIDVVIIRTGEIIDGKWAIPELDLEHFPPLTNFVAEFLKAIPPMTACVWGGSVEHTSRLRVELFAKATSIVSRVSEQCKDFELYSEAIGPDVLSKIASQHLMAQGKKCYAVGALPAPLIVPQAYLPGSLVISSNRSGASSRSSALNPTAASFVPQQSSMDTCFGNPSQYMDANLNNTSTYQFANVHSMHNMEYEPAVDHHESAHFNRGAVYVDGPYDGMPNAYNQYASPPAFVERPTFFDPYQHVPMQKMSPGYTKAQMRSPSYAPFTSANYYRHLDEATDAGRFFGPDTPHLNGFGKGKKAPKGKKPFNKKSFNRYQKQGSGYENFQHNGYGSNQGPDQSYNSMSFASGYHDQSGQNMPRCGYTSLNAHGPYRTSYDKYRYNGSTDYAGYNGGYSTTGFDNYDDVNGFKGASNNMHPDVGSGLPPKKSKKKNKGSYQKKKSKAALQATAINSQHSLVVGAENMRPEHVYNAAAVNASTDAYKVPTDLTGYTARGVDANEYIAERRREEADALYGGERNMMKDTFLF